MVRVFEDLQEFKSEVGKEIGASPWVTITQDDIDDFARVTRDSLSRRKLNRTMAADPHASAAEGSAAEAAAVRQRAHASPLARLFFGRLPAKGLNSFALPGGRRLFQAGEPADVFYMLRSGRLAVIRETEGRPPQVLGVIRPGEPVGEMALIVPTEDDFACLTTSTNGFERAAKSS